MTIAQLKTELREFIKLSETITPGEWCADGFNLKSEGRYMGHLSCSGTYAFPSKSNAAFIARSRNISPTMAKMLLVAVERLEVVESHSTGHPHFQAEQALQQLLKLWEETM